MSQTVVKSKTVGGYPHYRKARKLYISALLRYFRDRTSNKSLGILRATHLGGYFSKIFPIVTVPLLIVSDPLIGVFEGLFE